MPVPRVAAPRGATVPRLAARDAPRHERVFLQRAGIFAAAGPRVAGRRERVALVGPSEPHVGEGVGHGEGLDGGEREVGVLVSGGGDFGGGVGDAEAVRAGGEGGLWGWVHLVGGCEREEGRGGEENSRVPLQIRLLELRRPMRRGGETRGLCEHVDALAAIY